VSVYGTPAEEGGGGKIEMLDRGAFDGVHAAAMVHPGPVDVARTEPYAVSTATFAVHGLMTRGGEAPNAIPQRTEGRWYVRAETLEGLARLEPRVYRCFEAGAVATGCELTIEPESKPYAEFRTDEGLLDAYIRRAAEIGHRFSGGADALMNRASTDMGNVSQVIPAIHPYIGIDSLPAVNHQPEFAAAAASPLRTERSSRARRRWR
jgi:metal-dependent amidase/aminoacylase/carboxypeptidase family protein